MAQPRLYTIGHSTHPIEEFLKMLSANRVDMVADVRTVPRSRHNPQFDQHALAESLEAAGLEYVQIKKLGGLRHSSTKEPSINEAWRNKSFRSYADYMQTEGFSEGIDELIELTKTNTVAIMCAEAVPWRCHRSLVGDAMLTRGYEVCDIMSVTSTKPHNLTSFAKVEGTKVWYPPET